MVIHSPLWNTVDIERGGAVDELMQAVEQWLATHAPEHKGHHVQIGGGGAICTTCSMVDLTLPSQAEPVDRLLAAV